MDSASEEEQYSDDSSDEMLEDSDAGADNMEDSDDDEDYGFAGAEVVTNANKVPFKVLPREELQRQRQQAILDVTSVLDIPEDAAVRVLRKYKWDVSRVNEEWFSSNYEKIRTAVGLVDEVPTPSTSKERCLICFDEFPRADMRASACKHYFCKDCWRGYISNAIASGPASLDLRCPSTECKAKAAVPAGLVLELASADDASKYRTFQVRSFVEDNSLMSWCPGKNCENAIRCLVDRAAGEALDVMCSCGNTFCFSCKEEAHRPVACETVRKWVTKNSAESENMNMNWILANTKPCPKCLRPIEKNQGCMHMTCSQCRFEFCWLCHGDWKEHGERTGGFYSCNRFETAKKKGDYDDDTRRRENAKASLERYMHYFERFDAHSKAWEKAKVDASKVSADWLEQLADCAKTPTSQLKFINEAWHRIVECQRQLKWTYPYGYYAFEDAEGDPELTRQRGFFEFLQGDAERSLELLLDQAETKLRGHVESARYSPAGFKVEDFLEFRKKLIGLTDVTSGFFFKLVKQLEKGFGSMEAEFAGQRSLARRHRARHDAAGAHYYSPAAQAQAGQGYVAAYPGADDPLQPLKPAGGAAHSYAPLLQEGGAGMAAPEGSTGRHRPAAAPRAQLAPEGTRTDPIWASFFSRMWRECRTWMGPMALPALLLAVICVLFAAACHQRQA